MSIGKLFLGSVLLLGFCITEIYDAIVDAYTDKNVHTYCICTFDEVVHVKYVLDEESFKNFSDKDVKLTSGVFSYLKSTKHHTEEGMIRYIDSLSIKTYNNKAPIKITKAEFKYAPRK
ncbi:MAG: hypothetical protein ACRDD8_06325 [Bacteroidales bacterium]